MSKAEEKLKKIAIKEKSKWVEKAELRVANEKWLDKSAKIALSILRAMRRKGLTQKGLAEKLNISPQQINKILKGDVNLTLGTISKLETVLGIPLVEVNVFHTAIKSIPEGRLVVPQYMTIGSSTSKSSYKEMSKPITCPDGKNDSNKKKAA